MESGKENAPFDTLDPLVASFVYDFLNFKLQNYEISTPSVIRKVGDRTNLHKVGSALRSLGDEFASQFKAGFEEMCDRLEFNEDNIDRTIRSISNELFSDGIQWSRIVAFFVMGSELAIHCRNRNWHTLIHLIAQSMSSYISEKLLQWIYDHGGWEGLISYCHGSRYDHHQNDRNNCSWSYILLHPANLICLGISTISAFTLGVVVSKS